MRKVIVKSSVLFLLLIAGFNVSAQKADISGIITDSLTHEPISGAFIQLEDDMTVIAISNADGSFTLSKVSAGKHNIMINAASSKTRIVSVNVRGNELMQMNVIRVFRMPRMGAVSNNASSMNE